jgi:uncharacterized protein YukE
MAGVDIGRLGAAIDDYAAALREGTLGVTSAFNDLKGPYRALAEVYEGVAASEFKRGLAQTSEAFEVFIDGVPALVNLLEERAAALRTADQV